MDKNSKLNEQVFGIKKGSQEVTWFHKNRKYSNQHCLYCFVYIGCDSNVLSDKEHLISRKIAAPGFMDGAFNFIFRACVSCNREKSAIEDQISAVTLLTSPGRDDPKADLAAQSKAQKSFDRTHKMPVGEVRNNIKYSMGPFSFGMISGPQISQKDIKLLSLRHVQGLFSLCTSTDPRRGETTRVLPETNFGYFGSYTYRDWGNPQLLEIARRVSGYVRVAEITSAKGFFRASLRQGPNNAPWFWALEWNQNLRIVGWIGDRNVHPSPFLNLPDLSWVQISPTVRKRREVPLLDSDVDILFGGGSS